MGFPLGWRGQNTLDAAVSGIISLRAQPGLMSTHCLMVVFAGEA